MFKAATATSDALKASPQESSAVHSPFYTVHGVTMFKYYEQHPQYAARFAKAMGGAAKLQDRQMDELRDYFPWSKLSGTVVDVGGGSGHVSIALAEEHPRLNFVVQDGSSDMLAQGKRLLTPSVKDRVMFMKHDFFQTQPMQNVAAFFIRQCTHNWCDSDVITIFQKLVPGLENSRPGTPLLINESIMPEPGEWPPHAERALRQMDLLMLVGLGAKQRTKAEFEDLLKKADSRYEIVNSVSKGSMGLLEVHLKHDVDEAQ
ncbi:hypothetical protein G7054_g2976 [Neopestalotiopsis clavispora]|nr:hypothetical protein G7054_g2976 [Neopestalotiopsis clavispora]